MLQVSANYNSIFSGTHQAETMLVVGEPDSSRITITAGNIMALTTHQSLYGDYVNIGKAVMSSFNATLVGVSPLQIPKMSRVEVWCRLTNGSAHTNWLPRGIFYTRRPVYDKESTFMDIGGYDLLYKTETIPYEMGTTISNWESETTRTVANRMATYLGIALEDATQIAEYSYSAPPYGYSAREILEDIAKACGGNWTLTYRNTGDESTPVMTPLLRLVSIDHASTVCDLGRSPQSYDEGDAIQPIGYIVIDYGTDSNGATLSKSSGTSGTGRDMELAIETITDGDVIQEIADDLLDTLSYTYTPFKATGTELDPSYELGDTVRVNGVTAPLGGIDTAFSVAMYASIEAQGIPIDDDFPYESKVERTVTRNFATNKASISVNADSINAEVLRATSAEENLNTNIRSTLTQTADEIKATITTIETGLENRAVEQSKYIKYGNGKLELGTEGSQTKAVLSDAKLGFIDPTGDEKAFIGQDTVDGVYKFFVINGHIVNKLELGNHWDLVASGSDNENRLTIRWRN